jgi:hypothetical protein
MGGMKIGGFLLKFFTGLALITGGVAQAGVAVLTFHNDSGRTGANLKETVLAPTNVNADTFGKLFTYSLDGDVYTQPLYVPKLPIRGALHDVVFVATEHNSVYALDADTNGGPSSGILWHVNLGPPVATPNPDFGNRYGGFTEISPEVGITGTPVIDMANETIYLEAFTHEGSNYIHRLHALNILNGAERPYSPVVVKASYPGIGAGSVNGVINFLATNELQRCALTLAGGVLYVPYCGIGDTDPYHGWILGLNPTTLKVIPSRTFVTTPNTTVEDFGTHAGESGIWMGGSGLAVDVTGNLFLSTGNGAFNAYNGSGGTDYGDSFLKLSPSKNMSVLDYFTPYNPDYLWTNDLDIGSGGVMLLPDQPGPVKHLMVGGGKNGNVYVINRDQFTAGNNHCNFGATNDAVLQTIQLNGGSFDTPAYWNGTVYFTASKDVTAAFPVANGMFAENPASVGSRSYPFPGATASISANGARNGILWLVVRANPAILVADDATDVSKELYNSDQAGARDQLPEGTKFSVPTVADGKVFVAGQSALSVFGLLPGTNAPSVGVYAGLFYGSNGAQIGKSGYVMVTIGAKGNYIARLQWPAGIYSFSGQFNGDGAASTSLRMAGQAPLQIQMLYNSNSPPRLTGTVGNGMWQASLTAYESVFNARTNPAAAAGVYTVLIDNPGDTNALDPQGSGYGTATVNTAGAVAFHGLLADGTQISEVSQISADGQWPLYASLYAGRGQILGWVNFSNTTGADVAGNISWIRGPVPTAKSYSSGFGFASSLEGSKFTPGTAKAPLLNFTNGVVVLSGGAFSTGVTNFVTAEANGRFITPKGVTLALNSATGFFAGTAPNPLGGATVAFSGLFLRKQNYGSGFFIDSGRSGTVYLGPQ